MNSIVKRLLGYSTEYTDFLVRVSLISFLFTGIATLLFSGVLNIVHAALLDVELDLPWLVQRYPFFILATSAITLPGALIGIIILVNWLWLDVTNGNLDKRTSIKKSVSVGFVLAIGMTYMGVVLCYPKFIRPLDGLILFPFVAIVSCVSGWLIGKQVFKSYKPTLPVSYDAYQLGGLQQHQVRLSAFKTNLLFYLCVLVLSSLLIYFFGTLETTKEFLRSWHFLEIWDYALFVVAFGAIIYAATGFFTANIIGMGILENKIKKWKAFVLGFSIGLSFGSVISIGLFPFGIGNNDWIEAFSLILCFITFGCLNGFTAIQVWKDLQNS